MKVLFDADALIGLHVVKDPHHLDARNIILDFEGKTEKQYISWDVIDEVATKLRYQASKEISLAFLNDIFEGRIVIVYPTEELVEAARNIFADITMKHTSLTDCMNIAIYRKFELDAIFSFDKLYQQQGLRLLGDIAK